MEDFSNGLNEQEKQKYNHLLKEVHSSSESDTIKRLLTEIDILKEKGLIRLKTKH